MVFIGLISYSLYLWHWPLIAFSKYLMFRDFTWIDSALIILASFIFAIASWKFIEQPFRGKTPLLPSRKKLFAYASATMIIAAGIGGMIHVQDGMGWRYPEATAKMRAVLDDPVWDKHGDWEKITERIGDGVTPPLVGDQNSEPTFALIGDSHARALIPAIESHAIENNVSGYVITSGGVTVFQGVQRMDKPYDTAQHNENILEFLTLHPEVKTIILAGRWMYYVDGTYKQENPVYFQLEDTWDNQQSNSRNDVILKRGLERSLNTLLQEKKQIFLISSVPEIGYDVPRIYWMSLRYPWLLDIEHIRPTLEEYRTRQKVATSILKDIAKLADVRIVNPESRLFDENGKALIMANGESLYLDDDHLSTAGALYVAPVFDELFASISEDSSKKDEAKLATK